MKSINLYSIVIRLHVLIIAITVVGVFYVIAIGQTDYLIAFLTLPLINLLLIPLTRRDEKFDPSHPIIMILASLVIGTVLRSFFIISPLQSNAKDLMLLGKPPTILIGGIICIYIGIICFLLGYTYSVSPLSDWSSKKIFHIKINMKKFIPVAMLITMISLVVAWYHYKTLGVNFSDVSNISQKRFVKTDAGDYAASGYDHLFMGLVEPVFYIMLIYLIQKKKSVFSILGLYVFFLGFLNVLYPFIDSSRTGALYVLINTGLVIFYIKGGIKIRHIVWTLSTAMFLLIMMTVLRHKSNRVDPNITDNSPLIIMVGSLNFLGVDKTAQIIENVPDKMNYQFGKTLFLWTVAPIPRTMWHDKPEISIGRVIGEKIYEKRTEDTAAGGVPPGFIGELYLNFGYLGVIAGMFVLGLALKLYYNAFKKVRVQSPFAMVIYLLAFLPFELNLIGGDLSRMIVNLLITIIPLYVILKLTQSKQRIA